MELTAQQQELIRTIENWQAEQAPKGLNLDGSTDDGSANTAIIKRFMAVNRLSYDIPGLDAAVRLEAKRLIWAEGFGPKAAPALPPARLSEVELAAEQNKRRAKIADREDADKAKEEQAQRSAYVARQKWAADEVQREKDESTIIFYGDGDRIDHGATNRAREQARQKWAAAQGRSLAPTVIRELDLDRDPPFTAKEMAGYTLEEIKRAVARQKKGRGY
jgi:hypothetical protein